ncbi:MAG: sulfite exporter TauE/SafE family protein [Candidatus Dormibacteraceae bacterium]
MTPLHGLLIGVAGLLAGGINTVVGSGTLITFPTLVAFGYGPVTANVSNDIGLVAGGVSGTFGYRRELQGARRLVLRLLPASLLGSIAGAVLLIKLPPSAFAKIVPALIAVGVLLVIVGPWLQRRAAAAHTELDSPLRRLILVVGVFGAGIYGGYFGAAQGVLLIGLMNVLLPDDLRRITGIKNVLSTTVNAVSAVTFLVIARDRIDWWIVLLIAVGSFVGGVLGARVGRRLPPWILRAVIVVIGVLAIVHELV